eukprot:3230100-Pyramimonas_sp.AAC.1
MRQKPSVSQDRPHVWIPKGDGSGWEKYWAFELDSDDTKDGKSEKKPIDGKIAKIFVRSVVEEVHHKMPLDECKHSEQGTKYMNWILQGSPNDGNKLHGQADKKHVDTTLYSRLSGKKLLTIDGEKDRLAKLASKKTQQLAGDTREFELAEDDVTIEMAHHPDAVPMDSGPSANSEHTTPTKMAGAT